MLALWKESYDKARQYIRKQRHHSADKGPYSQSCDFSSSNVWMWELNHKEVWALKNRWFWTVLLEKTLESHLDSKEIKPVNPNGKETNPEYSLEELMLKLQYFGHLMWRADSLEKTLMLGKIEGRRKREWQGMRWLECITTQWTWVLANSRRWWRTGKPGCCSP